MSSKMYSYKVILLGERRVGKTSLFEAIKDMETEVEVEASSPGGFVGRGRTRSAISTLESQIDTCTKIVELGGGESAQLQICDTAVKVHPLMPQYYRKARLILLVYSCHNDSTLRALSEWIEAAQGLLKESLTRSYSFCLVGLHSEQFLEHNPPLTYDEMKVTQDSLSDFRAYHYISESLMFEVNMDTKEGLGEMLVRLGQAAKKLESAPQVGEVCSFTLSDAIDTSTATDVISKSASSSKKQSAPSKDRLDANTQKCC